MAQQFAAGSGIDPERRRIETHLRNIVRNRLKKFQYRSEQITDYLDLEPIPTDELVDRLRLNKRNAYYCGWNAVWQIADRNPRVLIELISEIFDKGNIRANTTAQIIAQSHQHAAIREVSERKLRALGLVAGRVQVLGRRRARHKPVLKDNMPENGALQGWPSPSAGFSPRWPP